jgi:hypothetical protein
MPRLVGKPLPDALLRLQLLGLLWSVAPLPALPASMRPSLFDNYRVSAQRPAAGTLFTQTVVREIPGGLQTTTRTVGLMTELRLKPASRLRPCGSCTGSRTNGYLLTALLGRLSSSTRAVDRLRGLAGRAEDEPSWSGALSVRRFPLVELPAISLSLN